MTKQEKLLDEFADKLLDERGLDKDLTEEVRVEMKRDILDRLNNFMIQKIVTMLSEEELVELEKYIKNNNTQEFWAKLKEMIPNFDDFAINTMTEFRRKYLAQ